LLQPTTSRPNEDQESTSALKLKNSMSIRPPRARPRTIGGILRRHHVGEQARHIIERIASEALAVVRRVLSVLCGRQTRHIVIGTVTPVSPQVEQRAGSGVQKARLPLSPGLFAAGREKGRKNKVLCRFPPITKRSFVDSG
jgi:hypothetical protein